ncbi:MAG: histidinol-phosphatase [Balneolales bacterium]|nr:histidinol-phosphatase [Balneolales bacterium]
MNLHEILDAAKEAASLAGKITLQYFQKNPEVFIKEDNSPVTRADREAEEAMRNFIISHFPEHGIIGEEFGTINDDADVKWILDPIDGTVGFIHGIPLYTNLIGITMGGKAVAGVINAPATGEIIYAADGLGAHYNGNRAKVRTGRDFADLSMMTSDVQYFSKYGYKKSFEELLTRVGTHRTYGDAYGHLMVASGRADIMMDPVLSIWDAAALLPVIEQAGGSFTDLLGNARIDGGNGFSCAPEHKEKLLHIFKTYS